VVQSMTGFGRNEGNCGGITCRIEVRSVNHRYCDTNVRLPDELARLEQRVRSVITHKFSRGKFDVSIIQMDASLKDVSVGLKSSTIKQYHAMLRELSKAFNANFIIRNDIGLSDLMALKDLLTVSRADSNDREIDEPVMKILNKSLEELKKMRLKEGHTIYKDLERRIGRVESMAKRIVRHIPVVVRDMKKRYISRVMELSEIPLSDMERLYQEIAIMVERMDITEEVVRINSHIAQLKDKLEEGGVVGRTLDFLLQEINREINTIAAKASDIKISQLVVEIKSEVERIREQVQNIE